MPFIFHSEADKRCWRHFAFLRVSVNYRVTFLSMKPEETKVLSRKFMAPGGCARRRLMSNLVHRLWSSHVPETHKTAWARSVEIRRRKELKTFFWNSICGARSRLEHFSRPATKLAASRPVDCLNVCHEGCTRHDNYDELGDKKFIWEFELAPGNVFRRPKIEKFDF